jgi:hypothetical protein
LEDAWSPEDEEHEPTALDWAHAAEFKGDLETAAKLRDECCAEMEAEAREAAEARAPRAA